MKYSAMKESVVQSFIFNTVCLIVFIGIGMYYMIPAYGELSSKKDELITLSESYNRLNTTGLPFTEFKGLHGTAGNKKELNDNTYLLNVLENFSEQEYGEYFINSGDTNYANFLERSIANLQAKKSSLDAEGTNDGIKTILPHYADDASIADDSLTDFGFVNYMENLLHTFNLKYSGALGIGSLTPVDTFESDTKTKKETKTQLEGKIYAGKLDLALIGKKKNIINFIHYIENVGQINIDDEGGISIKQAELKGSYSDLKRTFVQQLFEQKQQKKTTNGKTENTQSENQKLDESTLSIDERIDEENIATGEANNSRNAEIQNSDDYTSDGKENTEEEEDIEEDEKATLDIYNNLVMGIEEITFIEYIDGSDFTTPEKYTDLVSFVKKTQGDESYEVNIGIKFYVRGLPEYKLEEYANKVIEDHKNISKLLKEATAYVGKNKLSLKSSEAVTAINNLEKFNRYITAIEKSIQQLSKNLAKRTNLSDVHTQSAEYKAIFTMIKKQLQTDIKSLSEGLYEKNKETLGIKD